MKRNAFSLVELSIVLVILGLLVGGILAGQSLIRASELRATVADVDKVKTALHTFRDKYFSIPGDMATATSFWGDRASGTAACPSAATADGTPGTCNGNGNSRIDTAAELYLTWQHFQLASLWPGNLTGYTGPVPNGPGFDDAIGTNVPRSRIADTVGYSLGYGLYGYAAGIMSAQHTLAIAPRHPTLQYLEGNALIPADMWNIDTKADDGSAVSGSYRVFGSNTCVNSSTKEYQLATTTVVCEPLIGMGI